MSQRANQFPYALLLLMQTTVVAAAGLVLVQAPIAVWGLLHGDPRLLNPWVVIGGTVRLVLAAGGLGARVDMPMAWQVTPDALPPLAVAIVVDALVLGGVVLVFWAVWLRVDRWRARSHAGAASWSPRRNVRPRAFAKPRDLLHLQPRVGSRSGPVRRASNRLLRVLLWERRAPEPAGGDSWPLGRVRGAEIRSGREHHVIPFAPTGAGKTLRVLIAAGREHRGPAVFLSSKLDVLPDTIGVRAGLGPVWVYAPLSDLSSAGVRCCGWTPLADCESWSASLRMAQYLMDADPHASVASASSDGARFYNRQAVQTVLPALLHAAALGGFGMLDVYRWLGGGVDALDEPRDVLIDHDAHQAASPLGGMQHGMDDRTRSLLAISAAQLVGAYRHPEVQAVDRPGLDVGRLLRENGTLYLIAPESEQEALAPLFGGILGEVLRACEHAGQHVADPRELPLVKILADEAAHLAPLRKLPTYLAVSRGWGVRWLLVYQSVAQLRSRYGRDADAILANALAKLYMGPIHDRATRDELIALLGEQPVTQRSRTTDGWGSRGSTTVHEQRQPKLTADKLAQLGDGQAILVHGSDLPAEVKLPFWWEWEGARSPQQAHVREGVDPL